MEKSLLLALSGNQWLAVWIMMLGETLANHAIAFSGD
jgi:hypothetical protein